MIPESLDKQARSLGYRDAEHFLDDLADKNPPPLTKRQRDLIDGKFQPTDFASDGHLTYAATKELVDAHDLADRLSG